MRLTSKKILRLEKDSCLLGAHFSIAKGLHNALYEARAYGCTALQIFTKNAMAWKERTLAQDEIDRFDQAREQTGIRTIASHTPYLINLATDDPRKHALSCNALKHELVRASSLGISFVVLHPGACLESNRSQGIRRIGESIDEVLSQTPGAKPHLLLETIAGQGSGVGHTFEQLASIIDRVKHKDRLGICLDTSHIFAAGYDIRNATSYRKTFDLFDRVAGLDNLHLIHLNDSKYALGSRVDRHEHIGEGHIGIHAFRLIMNDERFKNIPKIIETPKSKDGKDYDIVNLNRLRALLQNS